ncbi:MAG: SlyX family protein [Gammaproteobacteria bacterium]|jgi:SlyX protein|nr:MAG: SlyX family protein [Gammaproteobacteria bacterium]
MSDGTDKSRLDELESRQAFQEDTIASLNEALVAQQQRIAYLEKMLELLIERYREAMPDIAAPAEEPPPPHY